jgi:hypothetical protein
VHDGKGKGESVRHEEECKWKEERANARMRVQMQGGECKCKKEMENARSTVQKK